MKQINPFIDVKRESIADNDKSGDLLNHVPYFQIGAGDKSMKVDQSGMWFGARKFADAPFSVTPDGDLIANNLTTSGYIAVGGGAADVNANATLISESKINVSELSALSADIGTVTSGSITGATIKTKASGARVQMNADEAILRFYDSGGDEVLRIDENGTDSLIKSYDNRHLALSANGSSYRVYINSDLDLNGNEIWSVDQMRMINRGSHASSNNTLYVKDGTLRFRDNGGTVNDLH